MSETTYKTFAVAGCGAIGQYIVEELLDQKAAGKVDEIVILTREVCFPVLYLYYTMYSYSSSTSIQGSTNQSVSRFASQGVKIISVDYSTHPSLVSAVTGINVVICTLGIPALFTAQFALASACKEAHVGAFLASNFGLRPNRPNVPTEAQLKEKLGDVGLIMTVVGSFADMIFKTVYVCQLMFAG